MEAIEKMKPYVGSLPMQLARSFHKEVRPAHKEDDIKAWREAAEANRGGGWADPARCDSEEDDSDDKDDEGREAVQGGVLYAMRQSIAMDKKRGQESAQREPTEDWGVGGLGQALQEASKAKREEQEKKVKEADNEVRALTRLLESASAMAATINSHLIAI